MTAAVDRCTSVIELGSTHAINVPSPTARNPPGKWSGNRIPLKYETSTKPSGAIETIGLDQISRQNFIEIKPIAMPASVDKRAARGVYRRISGATNAPKSSITPLPRQATSPICQAFSGLSRIGTRTKKTYTKREGGVDAERQRGYVIATFFSCKPIRLPGIKQIADHDRKSCSRKNAGIDQIPKVSAHPRKRGTEEKNQQKLHQVVNKETEKSVDVTGNKDPHSADSMTRMTAPTSPAALYSPLVPLSRENQVISTRDQKSLKRTIRADRDSEPRLRVYCFINTSIHDAVSPLGIRL